MITFSLVDNYQLLSLTNIFLTYAMKQVNEKNVLCRTAGYMPLGTCRIVLKTFAERQFNYCPLIWMLHSRIIYNEINRLHKRNPRIVCSDYQS